MSKTYQPIHSSNPEERVVVEKAREKKPQKGASYMPTVQQAIDIIEAESLTKYPFPALTKEMPDEMFEGVDFEFQYQLRTELKGEWKATDSYCYNMVREEYRRIIAVPLSVKSGEESKCIYTDTEFPGLKVKMDGIKEFLTYSGYRDKELDSLLKGIGYWFCHRYTSMTATPTKADEFETELEKAFLRRALDMFRKTKGNVTIMPANNLYQLNSIILDGIL